MPKVLIVDDAKLMRTIIRKTLLEQDEYDIVEASGGEAAVELYREERPDVVTMDIAMDGQNGLEAMQEILALDPNASVIVVTSVGQEKLLDQCIQTGARDFIVKPFSKERLWSAVRNVLNRRP